MPDQNHPTRHQAAPQLSNHLALEYIDPVELKLPAQILRRHPDHQIKALMKNIETFGFIAPVVIDQGDTIIAGLARIEAARRLKLSTVPAVRVHHLSDAELRAYRIADNKLAETAVWDIDALRIELRDLSILEIDLDLTGFSVPEVDILLTEETKASEEEPPVPSLAPGPAISCVGDLWLIGPHKIICGDALAAETYETLLASEKAAISFTDPPFNVPVRGHMGGLGSVQHREFVMASGEMSAAEFRKFLDDTAARLLAFTAPGGVVYIFMDWRSIDALMSAVRGAGFEILNLCVWNKTNGGMGSLYRSKHELVLVARVPGAAHRNNVELGRHGRNRTNVWDYPGANTPGQQMADLALHPTVKPVALIADAILDVSKRGDIVLDPFGGSGSTLLAADRVGRRARLIELDPLYVDTIIRRAEAALGISAVLAGSGETFSDVGARRHQAPLTVRRREPPRALEAREG